MNKRKKISVCVGTYNEKDNVRLMYQAIKNQMQELSQYDYEIIFEDNDSKDGTQDILREIASHDCNVKVILNATNFGATKSVTNLLLSLSGDAFIGLPCDFQEPPEMIPEFVKEWENGYDIVWGQKTKSKENLIVRLCRNLYYNIIDLLSDYKQLKHVTGFGLTDRKVIEVIKTSIKQDPELHIRHAISEYGFNIKLLPYEQKKRLSGKSGYSLYNYYDFAITSLCNTSVKPLRIMTLIGMIVAVASFLVAAFYFVYKLTHWYSFDAGTAPLVIGLFFVASVQLFSIGLLGEYIGILIRKVSDKPVIVAKEMINFDKEMKNEQFEK